MSAGRALADDFELLPPGNNAIGGFYGPFFTPENGLINSPEHITVRIETVERGPVLHHYGSSDTHLSVITRFDGFLQRRFPRVPSCAGRKGAPRRCRVPSRFQVRALLPSRPNFLSACQAAERRFLARVLAGFSFVTGPASSSNKEDRTTGCRSGKRATSSRVPPMAPT